MSEENAWGDECFYCDDCGKAFRSPLFNICRSVEKMHFQEEPCLPEAEVLYSEAITNSCCSDCLGKARQRVLTEDSLTATFPGPGPIESCSRCAKPVDMTKPHKTWTEEESTCFWSSSLDGITPINVEVLAVTCQQCDGSAEAACMNEMLSEAT